MTGRVNDDVPPSQTRVLHPGDSNPDLSLEICGSMLYCCHLSSRMCLFTLRLDDASHRLLFPHRGEVEKEKGTCDVLDVILKFADGWDLEALDHISATLLAKLQVHCRQPHEPLRVRGYLERMRRKFATDSTPLCLHAQTVYLSNDTKFQAAMPAQPKPTAIDTSPQASHNHVTQHTRKRIKTTDRGAKDGSRFGKVVQFLLQEFGGYDVLSQKPVLDVAGGSGGLAFELSVRHAIPTIVVDTKVIKWKSHQLRCLAFRQQNLQQLAYNNNDDDESKRMAEMSPLVHCLRNRFQSLEHVEQFQTWLETSWVLPSSLSHTHNSNGFITSDNPPLGLDDTQQKLYSILHNRQCSVMVGLHADQATHPIIEIGLALRIPWIVIPCCVFPSLFHQRKLKSGRRVKSYEDLCEFILEQDRSIREVALPFRGRNRAFYWHPCNEDNTSH